jgi:hypothetical protein
VRGRRRQAVASARRRRFEPLAPTPARPVTTTPSWADFVEPLSPVVRELQPGDAPRDWMNDELPVGIAGRNFLEEKRTRGTSRSALGEKELERHLLVGKSEVLPRERPVRPEGTTEPQP